MWAPVAIVRLRVLAGFLVQTEHLVGIAMVCGNEQYAPGFLCGLNEIADTGIHISDGFNGGFELTRMANHVTIGEIDAHMIIVTGADGRARTLRPR